MTDQEKREAARQFYYKWNGKGQEDEDGGMLTKLMIKHNVGVSVEHVYEGKRIDSDFFAEEL